MDIFSEHVDPSRDMPTTRKAGVDTDNDFIFKQEGPYGFWNVSRERGQVPESLSGAYTSIDAAREAVQVYANKLSQAKKKTL
jgi:hypothetical protein